MSFLAEHGFGGPKAGLHGHAVTKSVCSGTEIDTPGSIGTMEVVFMSRVRLVFFGLLAVLAVSAVASTSASASGPYIYEKGGSSPLMGSLELQINQVGSAKMNATLAGVAIEIVCETSTSAAAPAENVLTTGIEHFLSLHWVHFLRCTVVKPAGKGCLVKNELILVHVHILGVAGPLVRATPEGGNPITLITIDNCSNTALNGVFPAEGSLSATPNNTNSTIEYTATSGSLLTFGGNPAKFIATFGYEMLGGGLLEIK